MSGPVYAVTVTVSRDGERETESMPADGYAEASRIARAWAADPDAVAVSVEVRAVVDGRTSELCYVIDHL